MKLVVIGLSLGSSWGNGHATTYRALLRAFAARGHDVVFYEWDAPWYRGEHRDLPDPDFCRLCLYPSWDAARSTILAEAREADAVLVGSYVNEGPRVIDDLLAAGVDVHFYDIDTPVTVAQLRGGEAVSIHRDQVPALACYLSFTGGPFLRDVVGGELGARRTVPLYCAVDLDDHAPAPADPGLRADLGYMGTYAPDRQPGLERLLLEPARARPARRFLVAGPQYPDTIRWPDNVRRMEHLPPARHAAFYSSCDWQLNLTRADMRRAGHSPSVRLFEAAACGAAILSDVWSGLDAFLEPGVEVLLVGDADDVLDILETTHADDRAAIGRAARARIHAGHTARHRAAELEAILAATRAPHEAPATGSAGSAASVPVR